MCVRDKWIMISGVKQRPVQVFVIRLLSALEGCRSLRPSRPLSLSPSLVHGALHRGALGVVLSGHTAEAV